jgi:hypothetical protein
MTDGYIQVQPDSTGKKIDNSELTVGTNTVERQRIVISDPDDAAGLAAANSDPSAIDVGLVVRSQPIESLLEQILDQLTPDVGDDSCPLWFSSNSRTALWG